jgi:mannosyltransferase OCH1-like enzyme
MIPKIIHYTWLVPVNKNGEFNEREFNMHHAASVKSAHYYNPDFTIKFHTNKAPQGIYFDSIRDIIEITHAEPPTEVFGNPIDHITLKSTVLRNIILLEQGGVYQDFDIITMRPYEDLLKYEVCMGYELSDVLNLRQVFYFLRTFNFDVLKYKFRIPAGLCAGFIMSEPNNPFLKTLHEEYRKFDNNWSYYGSKLPMVIYKTGKYNVHIISPYQSHFPSCWPNDLKMIFERNTVIKGKYFLHVWESRSYEQYLKPLTREIILRSDTTYCNAIKQFV